MLEARAEVRLGVVRLAEAATRQQSADRVGEMQLGRKLRDRGWIRLVGEDPSGARPSANGGGGSGHRGKLRFRRAANNHQSAAYSITPHPSQISVAPVPSMPLRR